MSVGRYDKERKFKEARQDQSQVSDKPQRAQGRNIPNGLYKVHERAARQAPEPLPASKFTTRVNLRELAISQGIPFGEIEGVSQLASRGFLDQERRAVEERCAQNRQSREKFDIKKNK